MSSRLRELRARHREAQEHADELEMMIQHELDQMAADDREAAAQDQLRRAKAYAQDLLDKHLRPADVEQYQEALNAYNPDGSNAHASLYFYELSTRALRASRELDNARTDQ